MSRGFEPWTWRIRAPSSSSFLLNCFTETPSVCMQRRLSFIWTVPPGCRRAGNHWPSAVKLAYKHSRLSRPVPISSNLLVPRISRHCSSLFSLLVYWYSTDNSLQNYLYINSRILNFVGVTPRAFEAPEKMLKLCAQMSNCHGSEDRWIACVSIRLRRRRSILDSR